MLFQDTPAFPIGSHNIDAYEGTTTDVNCTARGHDSITWHHENSGTNITSPYPFPWCKKNMCTFDKSPQTLTIVSTPLAASGNFVCTAICNETGHNTTQKIILEVHRKYLKHFMKSSSVPFVSSYNNDNVIRYRPLLGPGGLSREYMYVLRIISVSYKTTKWGGFSE